MRVLAEGRAPAVQYAMQTPSLHMSPHSSHQGTPPGLPQKTPIMTHCFPSHGGTCSVTCAHCGTNTTLWDTASCSHHSTLHLTHPQQGTSSISSPLVPTFGPHGTTFHPN